MTLEKIENLEPLKVDEPRPASPRLINQLQTAVRRAQERKEKTSVSPRALFAAALDTNARGREPVEFLGSLGKRGMSTKEKAGDPPVD